MKDLEDSEQDLRKKLEVVHITASGSKDFRNKLEETEERMGEENAYLRECMMKLQEELANNNI